MFFWMQSQMKYTYLVASEQLVKMFQGSEIITNLYAVSLRFLVNVSL